MNVEPNSSTIGINDLPKLFRFVFWGGFNTLVSYCVYCLFVYLGAHIYIASIFSLIVGILLGHYLNKTNVFKSRHQDTLHKYFVLWLGLYLVHIAILTVLTRIGLNAYVAGIISGGLLLPVSFLFQKKIFLA